MQGISWSKLNNWWKRSAALRQFGRRQCLTTVARVGVRSYPSIHPCQTYFYTQDMKSVALLSLLWSSGEFGCCWFVVWWKEDLPGLSIRCYTRGLIGGSPRRRRQTEMVKEEEPQLLFCADNQICMISGWTGFSSFLMLAPKGALHAIIGQFPLSPALVSA